MTKTTLVLLISLIFDSVIQNYQIQNPEDIGEISWPDLTGHDDVGGLASGRLRDLPNRSSLASSMGGYVALCMTRRAPDRTERLAHLYTSARVDINIQARKRWGLPVEAHSRGCCRTCCIN